jgi:hypothetical protein
MCAATTPRRGDHSNARPLSAQPREASVIGEFESIVNAGRGVIDPVDLRKILVDYPARICKVELGDGGGTGFLVGPDLVLTNFHVMEPVLENRARPRDVICRFDYSKQVDGAPIGAGIECRLASPDWCVAKSPTSEWDLRLDGPGPAANELDYCLIRLADKIGEARLGGSSDGAVPQRGWMAPKPRQSVGGAGEQLFILQHPRGAVLKLAIGDHLGINSIGNRFRYDMNTQKGSSGSPVFNAQLELIGMHNSGWADGSQLAADGRKANQGIPISNIAALIIQTGVALAPQG